MQNEVNQGRNRCRFVQPYKYLQWHKETANRHPSCHKAAAIKGSNKLYYLLQPTSICFMTGECRQPKAACALPLPWAGTSWAWRAWSCIPCQFLHRIRPLQTREHLLNFTHFQTRALGNLHGEALEIGTSTSVASTDLPRECWGYVSASRESRDTLMQSQGWGCQLADWQSCPWDFTRVWNLLCWGPGVETANQLIGSPALGLYWSVLA